MKMKKSAVKSMGAKAPSVVFAQFPEWGALSSKECKALFGQACELWRGGDGAKAKQLFRYLWENDYSREEFEAFAEASDGEFQCFYAHLQADFLGHGDIGEAMRWFKKAAGNGCAEAKEALEDWCPVDHDIVDYSCTRLEALNKKISDAFYKTHSSVWDMFMGEQCAMLNESGHIEFVERECCQWNPINGAEGLILAKDKPVSRSQFKMTGFSPELSALLTRISKNKSEFNCYPNVIDLSFATEDGQGETSFDKECDCWMILLELLEHGYSLVQKSMYTMDNSEYMSPATHQEIEDYRRRFIKALIREKDAEERKPSRKGKKKPTE